MPKLGLPQNTTEDKAEVNVTKVEIEKLIQRLDVLLEGRIDNDNVFSRGSDYALVGHNVVQDIAGAVRPIGGRKVFGEHDDNSSFYHKIWQPLGEALKGNKTLITLTGKKQFSFINESGNLNPIQKILTITIPVATNIRPITSEVFTEFMSDNEMNFNVENEFGGFIVRTNFSYSMDLTKQGDLYQGVSISQSSIVYSNNSLIINYSVSIKGVKMVTNDFYEIYLEPTILCEVLR